MKFTRDFLISVFCMFGIYLMIKGIVYIDENPKTDCGTITFEAFQDNWQIEYNSILHKEGIAYYIYNGHVVLVRPKDDRGIKTLTDGIQETH